MNWSPLKSTHLLLFLPNQGKYSQLAAKITLIKIEKVFSTLAWLQRRKIEKTENKSRG